MKIAIISFHFAEYSFLLANALASKNEVVLMLNKANASNELGNRIEIEKHSNLTVFYLTDYGLKNPMIILNVFKILKIINGFNPEVIHCQEAIKDYLMGALWFMKNRPLVLTIHDHVPHTGKDSRDRKRIVFYKDILRKLPDAVIVHGEKIISESQQLMPWLENKLFSVPHGVLGKITSGHDKNWQPGVVLFFGRIEEYKGLKYFIEAVNIVSTKYVSIKGIIAGTGQDLENHKSDIINNDNFELIDRYIKDVEVPTLFNRANVVILPYTDATQSGVVATALSYGRPIVTTRVGSIDEVVKDGVNGLIVQPKDAQALADAMFKIISNTALANEMADNARQLAETELSWSCIADKTMLVYKHAIELKS